MKKLLIINIFAVLFVFFLFDFYFFNYYKNRFYNNAHYIKNMTRQLATEDADNKYLEYYDLYRRSPVNTNLKGKSIIFTGCSNTYGVGLDEKQTLHYYVSNYLKRPVYNFAFYAWGLNNTYYLLSSGELFKRVTIEPDIFIYSWADFHLERTLYSYLPLVDDEFFYNLDKNGNFVRKTQPFIIPRFPLLATIKSYFIYNLLYNSKSFKKVQINYMRTMFIKSKEILNKKYPNAKFVILLMYPKNSFENYFDDPSFEEELEKNGFIIIRVFEDLGINFWSNPDYIQPDTHPTALFWQVAAPPIAKRLKELL